MDELLITIMVRLAGIYESLGPRVYAEAGRNALLGIARAAQTEAERRAGTNCRISSSGPVIPFPLGRARNPYGDARDSEDT